MSEKNSLSNPLQQEIETYNKMTKSKDNAGKFVLIKGKAIKGFFSSREEALARGYKEIGVDEPFLVKEIFMPGQEPVLNFTRSMALA